MIDRDDEMIDNDVNSTITENYWLWCSSCL